MNHEERARRLEVLRLAHASNAFYAHLPVNLRPADQTRDYAPARLAS